MLGGLAGIGSVFPSLVIAGYVGAVQLLTFDTRQKLLSAGLIGFICALLFSFLVVSEAPTILIYVLITVIGAGFSVIGGFISIKRNAN